MRINKLIHTALLLFTLAVFLPINPRAIQSSDSIKSTLLSPATMIVYADSFGLDNAVPDALKSKNDLTTQIGFLIQGMIGGAGAVFLILVIIGGNMWMQSGGNEESVKKAKKLLATATIGLFIMLAGYIVTYFIVSAMVASTQSSSLGTSCSTADTTVCSAGTTFDTTTCSCR